MAVQVLKNKVAQCVSYWWTQVTFEQTTSTAILPLLMAPVHCPAEKRYEVEGETIYCFPGSVCQCQLADKKRSVVVRAYASLGAQHYLEIGCQSHECRHQAVGALYKWQLAWAVETMHKCDTMRHTIDCMQAKAEAEDETLARTRPVRVCAKAQNILWWMIDIISVQLDWDNLLLSDKRASKASF